ncbi:MAG TPA: prepilin-type N-terminal cleavage/methylation domain-containing protein [Kofleriaceae bacterium]|nr:prepilin-type N-terminal cleavage/methylation domain-containing protein [Kofleriaceae bacterium]
MKRLRHKGFTLIEVMFALALLGLALVVLIKSSSSSIFNAEQAHMLGVATDLGRGEMYEIEEILLKNGFSDTDQSQDDWKGFDDQGWPQVKYSYKVEAVEMPSFDQLQALATGHGSAAGSASNALGSAAGSGFSLGSAVDPLGTFQNSALGGMMSMMGGMGMGSSAATSNGVMGAQAGALIQSQYTMFQQILKVSVRKVTLKLKWQVLGYDRDLTFVAFYTDPVAMDQVLSGAGSTDLGDTSGGSGSGSGSGRGSGSGSGSGRR